MAYTVAMLSTLMGAFCTMVCGVILFHGHGLLLSLMVLLGLMECIKAHFSLKVFYFKKPARKRRSLLVFIAGMLCTLVGIFGIKCFQFLSTKAMLLSLGVTPAWAIGLGVSAMMVAGAFHVLRGINDVKTFVTQCPLPRSFKLAVVMGSVSLLAEGGLLSICMLTQHHWALSVAVPIAASLTILRIIRRLTLDVYLYGERAFKASLASWMHQHPSAKQGLMWGGCALLGLEVIVSAYLYGSQVHALSMHAHIGRSVCVVVAVIAAVLCAWRSLNSQMKSLHQIFKTKSMASSALKSSNDRCSSDLKVQHLECSKVNKNNKLI